MRAYAYTLDDLLPGRPVDAEAQPKAAAEAEVPRAAPAANINSIALRDIAFRYDQRYILRHFNLQIESGCFLGIEGDSGRGKTTLLHLLLGFLSPEQGQVLYNEEPIDAATCTKYRRNIAYVKQQPLILQDTLRTNVTLEEGADNPRLGHVLKISGLDALIEKLPGGLEARIAENGRNISGGQRQRIAIARALYKPADVYILDEPFSELDETAEDGMLAHFRQLSREGKIVILITHNKKSLAWCTRRISLQEEMPEKTIANGRTFFL
jgi:ABC-type bacteriocin/lantibiotic exporter with double-glycine peptidase domain